MLRNSRASESRWLPALVLAALALLVLVAVAPDGHPDVVSCGRGKDLARVDPNDVVRGCAWKIKLAAGHHVGGRNNGRSSGGHRGAGGHGGRAGPGGGNDGGAGRGDG